MRILKLVIVLLVVWVFGTNLNAKVVLDNSNDYFELTKLSHDEFEDKSNSIPIEYFLTSPNAFQNKETNLLHIINENSTHWVKYSLVDNSSIDTKWFIELYNYRIDFIEFYLVLDGKIIQKKLAGDQYDFELKEIIHKNFAFPLPTIKNKPFECYFKIKSSGKADFLTVIKNQKYFISYSTSEYASLGFFYGFLFFVLVINILFYIYLKERVFFFYFGYVFFFVLFSASQDGFGFQYLWPNSPELNNYIGPITMCGFIVNQLMFTYTFFKNVNNGKTAFGKLITLLIVFRIAYLVFGFLFCPTAFYYFSPDIVYPIFMLYVGIVNYKTGYNTALYFIIGVCSYLFGYVVFAASEWHLIHDNILTVYAINFGIIGEMVATLISVADKSKRNIWESMKAKLALEKSAQKLEFINQSQKELTNAIIDASDEIVKQSHMLNAKNRDLDLFIYKSSHNLMGPIKTIKGLVNISKVENDKEQIKALFKHIESSNDLMEKEINGINLISRIIHQNIVIEPQSLAVIVKEYFGDYNIKGDVESSILYTDFTLVSEMQKLLTLIIGKISKNNNVNLYVNYEIKNSTLLFVFEKNQLLKSEYIKEFFLPFSRSLSFLFQLDFEPYVLKCIIEKLNGQIKMVEIENNQIELYVSITNLNII